QSAFGANNDNSRPANPSGPICGPKLDQYTLSNFARNLSHVHLHEVSPRRDQGFHDRPPVIACAVPVTGGPGLIGTPTGISNQLLSVQVILRNRGSFRRFQQRPLVAPPLPP